MKPYVDLYALFKKNANALLANNDEQDRSTLENIQQTCNSLNAQISSLSGIKSFEEKLLQNIESLDMKL